MVVDRGAERLSLTEIAEHAGVGKATAYKLFVDKRHLLRFVGSRLLAELDKFRLAEISQEESGAWRVLCVTFIDRTAEFYKQRPAARILLLSDDGRGDIQEAEAVNDAAFVGWLRARFSESIDLSRLPHPRYEMDVLLAAVEIVDALFALGSRIADGEIPPRFVAEAKRACLAYLATYFNPDLQE